MRWLYERKKPPFGDFVETASKRPSKLTETTKAPICLVVCVCLKELLLRTLQGPALGLASLAHADSDCLLP